MEATEQKLTEQEVTKYIEQYRGDLSELGRAKFDYYKELLAYKRELYNKGLRELIRNKLNAERVGGSYSRKQVSTVIGIPVAKVEAIEKKVLRLLKHPTKSRELKKYINQGA